MTAAELIGVLSQIGLGAAALHLANALKVRVNAHETRITELEKRTPFAWPLKMAER